MDEGAVKKFVREHYAKVARTPASCCGGADFVQLTGKQIGYRDEELQSVPEGANLGLGCGNPVALASLEAGETVLDLGAGAGFDCFLAANRVGQSGRVIGVDMTPEMIDTARRNARKGGYGNVEFRLGEIENLPVADSSVDVVISNCVINLSPDKPRVFSEAFRVLKAGGRLMVSDIVLSKELPSSIKDSILAYVGCISGALLKEDYLSAIRSAGFGPPAIVEQAPFAAECLATDPVAKGILGEVGVTPDNVSEISGTILSVRVQAVKPH